MLAIVMSLAPIAVPATAQDEAEFAGCMDRAGGVSTEMLRCGAAQIAQWDLRLNAAYRTLLQRAGGDAARLRDEQRTWLRHHRDETRRLAADPGDGSAAFLQSQSFELGDLEQRTLELERRVGSR